jgi:Na+-transporting methylmalonyl-CoA/oxaloacetate decarboxylase gamma subunit
VSIVLLFWVILQCAVQYCGAVPCHSVCYCELWSAPTPTPTLTPTAQLKSRGQEVKLKMYMRLVYIIAFLGALLCLFLHTLSSCHTQECHKTLQTVCPGVYTQTQVCLVVARIECDAMWSGVEAATYPYYGFVEAATYPYYGFDSYSQ